MKAGDTVAAILGCIAISLTVIAFGSGPSHAAAVATEAPDVEASTALIREIQFMLLRLAMDPGPIDGIAGPQTLSAVRKFEVKSGLPISALITDNKISGVFLARLRDEASRAILGGE